MYKILCVGKIKEKYLKEGLDEYAKRIMAFSKLDIVETKEYTTLDISKNIEAEGLALLEKLTIDDYVITLEINGQKMDSVTFSQELEKLATYGKSRIVFVIGGSNGLSNKVKARSNLKLSFSDMTFPHQLMRLILVEQLYRALTIINHKEYHK